MIYDKIVEHVLGINAIITCAFDAIWKILDDGKIVRRSAFYGMMYITYASFEFCYKASEASNWNPAVIAACFAILTPVAGLQGTVIKFYNDARKDDN